VGDSLSHPNESQAPSGGNHPFKRPKR